MTWVDHAFLVDAFIVGWLGCLAAAAFSGLLYVFVKGLVSAIDWWQGYP